MSRQPDLPANSEPAAEALRKFVELASGQALPAELAAQCRSDDSPASLALLAHAAGVPVQVVRLTQDDLRSLRGPVMLHCRDGGWWVVQGSRRAKRVRIRALTRGEAARGSAERADGLALVASAPLLEGEGLLARLIAALRKQKGLLLHLAVLSALTTGLTLIPPLLAARLVTAAVEQTSGAWFLWAALGVLAVAGLEAWTGLLRGRSFLAGEAWLDLTLGRSFLDHTLHLPFHTLLRRTTGELLQAFQALGTCKQLVAENLLAAVLDAATLLSCLLVVGLLMPGLGLLWMALSMLIVVAAQVGGRPLARLRRREIEARASQQSLLVEIIGGIGSIKIHGAEAQLTGRWRRHLAQELLANFQRLRRSSLWEALFETLRRGVPILVLGIGGVAVLDGRLGLGELIAILAVASPLSHALTRLAQAQLQVSSALPELRATRSLFSEPAPARRPSPLAPRGSSTVELEGVWFRYEGRSPWVLRGVSFEVGPGQRLRVGGAPGAGKTTLFRLIAGLYSPYKGSVRIGGQDPTCGSADLLCVPQGVRLFGGTILENLRILSGQAPHERLLEAAEETGLAEWIATLPMGLHTVLPAGAVTLSGGQRQLVVLTAVAATRAAVLLLDEPFTNLDIPTRAHFLRCASLAEKTILYASHENAGLGSWNRDSQTIALTSEGGPE